MRINIELFEFPTKEEMLTLITESPLYNFKIEDLVFHKKNLNFDDYLSYIISTREMLGLYKNRISQLNLSYAYILYYLNRGIPDAEWSRVSSNGSIEYFPHFKDAHWTNKIHFEHHTDALFQRAFTTLDILGHLLFNFFDLKHEKYNDGRLKDITFNTVLRDLKNQRKDIKLNRKLCKIKYRNSFQQASRIRNNIIHNKPPYRIYNYDDTHDGMITSRIDYTPSKELKENMYNLLKSIKEITQIIIKHIEKKSKSKEIIIS